MYYIFNEQSMSFFSFLAICTLFLTSVPSNVNAESKHMSVTISMIIDIGEVDDALIFLQNFNCNKWSIVLTTGIIEQGWLNNASFVSKIKQYGECIPALWMAQTHDNTWKKAKIDEYVTLWETKLGYKPYGFFMFQPDTYIANYLYANGVKYIQGYCFDQYAVDWMSMRGGWQQPYYASQKHVLIPSFNGKGIIILPHVIWDWRDSFEIDHQYNSQPIDAWTVHGKNYTQAKNYILDLMNATLLSVNPYSYFTVQNEIFGWNGQFRDESTFNHTDFFKVVIENAHKIGATVECFNETAKWFNDNFPQNPEYRVYFTSPYSNKTCEWVWNSYYRITRYEEYVVGYISYQEQNDDPYLTSTATPNFQLSPHDPNNCVDNSLTFIIDDFGNGNYRAPPKGNRVYYTGELSDFPEVGIPELNIVLFLELSFVFSIFTSIMVRRRRQKQSKNIPSFGQGQHIPFTREMKKY